MSITMIMSDTELGMWVYMIAVYRQTDGMLGQQPLGTVLHFTEQVGELSN